jgi:signal transduction histidine kinase
MGQMMNKRRWVHGIRQRWMLIGFGIYFVTLLLGVAAYAITASYSHQLNLQADLQGRALGTARMFNQFINTNFEQYLLSATRFASEFEDTDRLELQFLSLSGRIIISTTGFTTGLIVHTPDVAAAIATREVSSWTGVNQDTGETVLAVSAPLVFAGRDVVGVLRYVSSLQNVRDRVTATTGQTLLIGLGILIVVGISNWIYFGTIVRPINQITSITERIAGGRYGVQITKRRDDEIGRLIDSINNMSTEIRSSERMKTDFMATVSHELRTPLTAISGWSETLLVSEAADRTETLRGLRIIRSESDRLTHMVENLLDFTRMEGGRLTLSVAKTDLRAELEDVLYLMGESMAREGIRLEYAPGDGLELPVPCDIERVKQVFLNVLDNAQKHGSDGGHIAVDMGETPDGREVWVQVSDHGIGIPADELPHIKLKFYKGSGAGRGSGIGLAMCEEIVNMHGGRLEIHSISGAGTTVTFYLPRES